MRKLLNVLYVTNENAYLTVERENVVIKEKDTVLRRYPLHTIEGIICFSYLGASPALMGKCTEKNIGLTFCSPSGRFLAKCDGKSSGNVYLRREQYRIADNEENRDNIARDFIFGKIYNCKKILQRVKRDHLLSIDVVSVDKVIINLQK